MPRYLVISEGADVLTAEPIVVSMDDSVVEGALSAMRERLGMRKLERAIETATVDAAGPGDDLRTAALR